MTKLNNHKKQSIIPQIQPWIDQRELRELIKVIDSTWITEGRKTEEFENRFKKITGARYAMAVFNATVGLYCALKAFDIGPGDEVIVPDLTFIASANSVIMAGAKPVFCDIERETLGLDPNQLEKKITFRTKAVMPVHLYGLSAKIDKIINLARKRGLKVIEDAAQAVGVKYKGRQVGTFGDIGIFSFYGNKTITTGEGGLILTDNKELFKKCWRLKNHGRDEKGIFIHDYIGFNFCFTDLQAAVGLAQLKKLKKIIERKRRIREFYQRELKDIKQIEFPSINRDTSPVFWFTNIFTDEVSDLVRYLKEKGVQTRRFFYPLHKQPCYNSNGYFPNSEWAYEKGLSLPSSVILKDKELAYICATIKDYYQANPGQKFAKN